MGFSFLRTRYILYAIMARNTNTLTRVALFAAILALSAYIRIPAGPVPLTLQSTAALLCGYCLGPREGASATLLYTAVGLAGLPVFTSGGGPAYLLSPTFGYIVGFTFCALATGALASLVPRGSAFAAYCVMLAGLVCLYIPGVLWLTVSLRAVSGAPPDIASILRTGLIIPFAGDILKTIPAAAIGVRLRAHLMRRGGDTFHVASPRGADRQ
jgi:biotin transport system substrate-specific component